MQTSQLFADKFEAFRMSAKKVFNFSTYKWIDFASSICKESRYRCHSEHKLS